MKLAKALPMAFVGLAVLAGVQLVRSAPAALPIQHLTLTGDVGFEQLNVKVGFHDQDSKDLLVKTTTQHFAGWILGNDGRFLACDGHVFGVYGRSFRENDAKLPMPNVAMN